MFLYYTNLIAAVIGVIFMAFPLQCFNLCIFMDLDVVWHCGNTWHLDVRLYMKSHEAAKVV